MDGQGTLRFANGARFKGTFREGKRDGKSVEIREDGSRIDCTYREGMKHGKYQEYDANGNLVKKESIAMAALYNSVIRF